MKLEVQIEGQRKSVDIERRDGHWHCQINGQLVDADILETSPGMYSILLSGQVLEACVAPRGNAVEVHVGTRRITAQVIDPRRWQRRHGAMELEGSQEVLAPMPGKVIRVLVAEGESVDAGQGLMVLEAMKMQNEVQSPKAGTLERLLVNEGQPVNAGDALAVVA